MEIQGGHRAKIGERMVDIGRPYVDEVDIRKKFEQLRVDILINFFGTPEKRVGFI